jgi:tetratricopeptide (TPR) repeat protein
MMVPPRSLTRRHLLMAAAALPLAPARSAESAATEVYQQARRLYARYTPSTNAAARALLTQAGPTSAAALSLLAATHRQDWNMGWVADVQTAERLAEAAVQDALALARTVPGFPDLPGALEQLGWLRLYQGRHLAALRAAHAALRHTPTFAGGYGLWAHALTYLGRPRPALAAIDQAAVLQPEPRFPHLYHRGCAALVWGILAEPTQPALAAHHFGRARDWLAEAVHLLPRHRAAVSQYATALMACGDGPAAGRVMDQRLASSALDVRDPAFEPFIRRAMPFRAPAIMDRLLVLWRAADTYRPQGVL